MITHYKILKGDGITGTHLLKVKSLTCTHGHGLSLEESRFRLKVLKGLFTVRTSRIWNFFLQVVISAWSIELFKK